MKASSKFAGPLLMIVALLLGWLTFSLGREWFLIYVFFGSVLIMAIAAIIDDARKTRRGFSKAPTNTGD